MTKLPPGVDEEIFKDLMRVEEARTLFKALGTPVQFWEAYCLVKATRDLLAEEVKRVTELREGGFEAGLARSIIEKLRVIRDRVGPVIEALREFLSGLPDSPEDPETLEISIGFLAASDKARESVNRWLADPRGQMNVACDRMRALTEVVGWHLQALKEARPRNAVPEALEQAEFTVPPHPPAPVAEKPELPKGVDPDILEDVRRIRQCRTIFEATHQQIEVWEIFCLVMLDRDSTKTAVDELLQLKEGGDTMAFNEGALGLFEILLGMRARHGKFVRRLRDYLKDLPIGTFGKETMEMALGFVVASERGRTRAQQWMDEPEHFKQEATGRLEGIISTVMNYETALRMVS